MLPAPVPKHTEERLKLTAAGCQNIALAVVVGTFLTPLLNPAFTVSLPGKVLAGVSAGIAELLALYLLGLIPTSQSP